CVDAPLTCTVNDSEALFPDASVAVHVTVVVPIANALPLGGTQATAGFGSKSSVAVALNVTTAPAGLVASAVIGPGTARTGGVRSVAHRLLAQIRDAQSPFTPHGLPSAQVGLQAGGRQIPSAQSCELQSPFTPQPAPV